MSAMPHKNYRHWILNSCTGKAGKRSYQGVRLSKLFETVLLFLERTAPGCRSVFSARSLPRLCVLFSKALGPAASCMDRRLPCLPRRDLPLRSSGEACFCMSGGSSSKSMQKNRSLPMRRTKSPAFSGMRRHALEISAGCFRIFRSFFFLCREIYKYFTNRNRKMWYYDIIFQAKIKRELCFL